MMQPFQGAVLMLILLAMALAPALVRWLLTQDQKAGRDAEERRRSRRLGPIMTGRQAAGRHLYGEAYGWNNGALHNYDNSPEVRQLWEDAAERKKAREPRA